MEKLDNLKFYNFDQKMIKIKSKIKHSANLTNPNSRKNNFWAIQLNILQFWPKNSKSTIYQTLALF